MPPRNTRANRGRRWARGLLLRAVDQRIALAQGDGTVQALAVSGSSRASALPDVPTTVEAGYPNSEYNFWVGMFAPAKAPADIRARLYAETAKALQQPATREKLGNLGADPMPLTSAQFEALVKAEIENNTRLVKAAGIKVN